MDDKAEIEAEVAEVEAGEEIAAPETEEGDLVVSIGEEAPPQQDEQAAPAWVREVRKQNRELVKRVKELEAQRKEPEKALPAKPTLETCDYDADAFEAKLAEWYEAKRSHDAAEAEKKRQEQEQEQAWQERLDAYEKAKQGLPAADVDDAEDTVKQMFDPVRWSIIVDGADNPALLIYALGKHPERAKELAETKSLSRFTFKAAKLEAELKTTRRKASVEPEKPITGTAGGLSGSVDNQLERLREKAMQTGNFTEVIRYKNQLRAAR